eukprot:TRINITY_DN5282_c0_g1_i1.p2 TRINITY_DN5282_c0_g1~~TRINITY_DN5282_c0_g1_i1.p2  ORF type:complete len:295 (+),score=42.88 TRINITY_DN5282_c0_g1_i1:1357-2241(+)
MPYRKVNGVELYYEAYLPTVPAAGPLVVFHHGHTGALVSWAHCASVLRELLPTATLLLFDCRGCGRSDKASPPERYSVEQLARDTVSLVDAVFGEGKQFVHVGHSMGGVVGMAIATSDLAHRLTHLVLVASAPATGIDVPSGYYEAMAAIRSAATQDPRAYEERIEDGLILAPRWSKDNPEHRAFARVGLDTQLSCSEAHFERMWKSMVEFRADLRLVAVPTLVIAASADGLLPANLRDFLAIKRKWSSLHVFQRVGHNVPREVPDELAAVLFDFFTHGVVNARTIQLRLQSRL